MQKQFSGYYRPDKKELRAIWADCLFVPDANVLLGLYRYPTDARNDLIGTLKQVSDRLWLPHQAALEYQENRLSVIADQVAKYDEVDSVLVQTRSELDSRLAKLQLNKRHSVIDPADFLRKIDTVFSEFRQRLQEQKKTQPDVTDTDTTRAEVDSLFNDKVGDPFPESELQTLYEEAKTRFEQRRPPGYLDDDKSKQEEKYHFFAGTAIRRDIGDLVLWKQILREARERESRHVVFITDDDKPDWWWIFKGRTIGPRPELVDEIKREAGVDAFYMYDSARFLKFAKEFLGAEIKQDSIQQVSDIAKERYENSQRRAFARHESHRLLSMVQEWLERELWHGHLKAQGTFPGLVGVKRGSKVGFEIKVLRDVRNLGSGLRNAVYQASHGLITDHFSEIYVVVVLIGRQTRQYFERALRQIQLPQGVKGIVFEAFKSPSGEIVDLHALHDF